MLLLSPIHREVAMKFFPSHREKDANKEYAIYTYLNAINNTNVQCNGVATVYYYGHWRKHDHTIMAITLMESGFINKYESGDFNAVDLLIMFQGFVSLEL